MRLRIILVMGLGLLLVLALIMVVIWYKPHRDIRKESYLSVTAMELFQEFEKDEKKANQLYLDKAIEITGEIAEVQKNQAGQTVIILKTSHPIFGVSCTITNALQELKAGQIISVRGFCSGLASDVVIRDCIQVN